MECFLSFLLMNCFSSVNDYLKINFMFWGCNRLFEVLILFLLFGFGLKVFKFTFYFKGFEIDRYLSNFGDKTGVFQYGFCSKDDLEFKCKLEEKKNQNFDKIHSLKCNLYDDSVDDQCCTKFSYGNCRLEIDLQNLDKIHSSKCNLEDYNHNDAEKIYDYDYDYDEDDTFDVLALRKLVKIERHKAKSVYLELEKERMASSTAAEEAMAMILRLQNEKSLIELEAKQYKRLVEEKQLHDQDVIRSLQWLVLKHESEVYVLEDQLRMCLQKQGNFEEYASSSENAMGNGLDPKFFSSLDMDLSIE